VQLRGRHIKWNVFAMSKLQLAVIMTKLYGCLKGGLVEVVAPNGPAHCSLVGL